MALTPRGSQTGRETDRSHLCFQSPSFENLRGFPDGSTPNHPLQSGDESRERGDLECPPGSTQVGLVCLEQDPETAARGPNSARHPFL